MEESTIARLVMGYLEEECLDAAAYFGAISPDMLEFRIQTFRKENPTTKVFDTTLSNILQEYKTVFIWIKNKFYEIEVLQLEFHPEKLIEHLETIIITVKENGFDQNDVPLHDSKVINEVTEENKNVKDEKSIDAQLVLGYLQDKCSDAAASFAATSHHLSNYRLQVFRNADLKMKISTTLNGMTLIDILQQYRAIRACIQKELTEIFRSPTVCNAGEFIKNLETIFLKIKLKSGNNQSKKRIKLFKNDDVKNETARIILNVTKEQESKLNEMYKTIKYIRGSQRQEIAKELGLGEAQIQLWFQRKRNEDKVHPIIQNTSCQNSADSSSTMKDLEILPHDGREQQKINIFSSSSIIKQEKFIFPFGK